MTRIWQTDDFNYELAPELIAQQPLAVRTASRLMTLNISQQQITHQQFSDIHNLISPNDLLVLNDTKVIPARLFGFKKTGGRVECLVERVLARDRVLAHMRASKAIPVGSSIRFADAFEALVVSRTESLYELEFDQQKSALEWLYAFGHIPLPPYIHRDVDSSDQARYQTVFAKHEGAVAAPTAGLHFDQAMLNSLKEKGVTISTVTLHIGAGTFQPVRAKWLSEHQMHQEYVTVSEAVVEAVSACRQRQGRVIAVGTTVVRSLETAAKTGVLSPYRGDSDLFIYPGFKFNCIDALITNFHLPKSTLLMLISAFGGYEFVMHAYQQAVKERYRFFSYGDAMFLHA